MSSAPGPKIPIQYGDYTMDGFAAFIPSIGDMILGLAMVSIGDNLQVSIITDQNCIKYPDEFIQILNEKF